MADVVQPQESRPLNGKLVALVGKLASMPKREAAQLVRQYGGTVVERPQPGVHLVVVGEGEFPVPEGGLDEWLDAATRRAVESGATQILSETQLWQQLDLLDPAPDFQRLYTPAMLAELLGVKLAVIRRWHRRGLIVPVREVRKLPYFDFQEVAAARRLAELLAAGVSPRTIEHKLEELARFLPRVARPLAQLSIIVQGKEILLRQGDGLIEPGGQLRFDFEAAEQAAPAADAAAEAETAAASPAAIVSLIARRPAPVAPGAAEMAGMAAELEDEGRLDEAADMCRAAMAAGGPTPELCFQLAELLYRQGDVAAARERYYMAIELDEDYVEARANLGCVLAETGRRELALAAFEGALAYHPDYADVHYHLARLLDELDRADAAREHWRAFLHLAPDSPWAEEAEWRLAAGE